MDIRSQMAVNLCASLDVPNGEKFRMLARVCAKWGLNEQESFPLALALKEKLGMSMSSAIQSTRAVIDGQEMELRKRN